MSEQGMSPMLPQHTVQQHRPVIKTASSAQIQNTWDLSVLIVLQRISPFKNCQKRSAQKELLMQAYK